MRFILILSFIVCVYSTTVTFEPITTQPPTTDNSLALYCDFFPSPEDVDEGNYGDMLCEMYSDNNAELLIRETLINTRNEQSLAYYKHFSKTSVARVNVMNFGRHHGVTTAVGIENGNGGANIEVYVEIYSGEQFRIFIEVYGNKTN